MTDTKLNIVLNPVALEIIRRLPTEWFKLAMDRGKEKLMPYEHARLCWKRQGLY